MKGYTRDEDCEFERSVGARIRYRRRLLGMTQQQLGDAVGISFQQVQKYENGTNRITAARLLRISQKLEVPASWFFDDLSADPTDAAAPPPLSPSRETMELARLYNEIQDPKARHALREMARTLAKAAPRMDVVA
jgi:transcriptional regulator with XRE-family HTH domain